MNNRNRSPSEMRVNARLPLLLLALPLSALADEGPAITYKPEADAERPMATEISVAPQGSNIALELLFDRLPWGEDCRTQCANATLFLDTDANVSTGVKLGKDVAETGADLAVTVQGARDYTGPVGEPLLRVKIRRLNGTTVDDSSIVAEYTHKLDPERVQSEDERVFVLVDATSASLPAGAKMRVIYHPPGSAALTATVTGMRAKGSGKVKVVRDRKGRR
jgi:hypothetical protein